jgi:tRNA-dependent cyclodipeptide synthase
VALLQVSDCPTPDRMNAMLDSDLQAKWLHALRARPVHVNSGPPWAGLPVEPVAVPRSVAGANLFIPISLGNHYYSSEILLRLMSDFIAHSKLSVIFLCDRLRLLSYGIRGETHLAKASANIRLQLDQLTRSLFHLGLDAHSNATVADWSFLAGDPRYDRLLASLDELVRGDPALASQLHGRVVALMHRFPGADGADRRQRMALQRQYVIEETALSLYMTEMRGFNVEVYRRGMGFVDDLYRERPAELMALVGKSKLDREFISIETWLAGEVPVGNGQVPQPSDRR